MRLSLALMENKKQALILRNKMSQLKGRAEDLNLDTLIDNELDKYRELRKSNRLQLMSFRMTEVDKEFVRDLTHSLKINWDPYITQAEVIHIAIQLLIESIGDMFGERPEVLKEKESRSRKPRIDKKDDHSIDLGFD